MIAQPIQPYDLDAERKLLASILIDPTMAKQVDLRGDAFYDSRHRILYGHATKLADGGAVEATILVDSLTRAGDLEKVGGAAYIGEVLLASPVADHATHYAEIVQRHATRRRVANTLESALYDVRQADADPIAVVSRVTSSLATAREKAVGIEYPALTAPQLMAAQFSVDYLLPGVLAARQPCLVFGPQKALKTSVVLDLAAALAYGGHFLGYFKASRAIKVALMTGESGMPVVQETLARIINAMGVTADHLGQNLIVTDSLPRFGRLDHLDAMEKFIRGHELEVVIIDPAYLCIPADDNGNLFAQGELLRAMSEVFNATGSTMMLVHHSKKSTGRDPFAPPELADAAWSGFAEWCRQWVMLGRRSRYEPGTGRHELWFSVGGSAGHSGTWALDVDEGAYDGQTPRRWEVSLRKPDEARRDTEAIRRDAKAKAQIDRQRQQIDADKDKILRALAKFPNGETITTISNMVGLNRGRFRAAAAEALQAGDIIQVEIMKPNRKTPYDGYKLSDTDTTHE